MIVTNKKSHNRVAIGISQIRRPFSTLGTRDIISVGYADADYWLSIPSSCQGYQRWLPNGIFLSMVMLRIL